jgi:hypothetical protein
MQTETKRNMPRLFSWRDQFIGTNNDKRHNSLKEGWPTAFRDYVLPNLAIDPVKPFFCSNNGRPTKDLRTMVGLIVLQNMFNLTDQETLWRLRFDLSFRWALDIENGNDETLYVCPKTYYNFQKKIKDNGLYDTIFNDTTGDLMEKFKVEHSLQRMDSMHFQTDMKRLSRLGVMSATVEQFLTPLKKEDYEAFMTIEPSLTEKYLKRDPEGYNYFGHVKPSDRDKVMLTVANDIFTLINAFQNNPVVSAMSSFKLLNRVFQEQCRVNWQEKTPVDAEFVLKGDDEVKYSDETSIEETNSDEYHDEEVENSNFVAEPKVELIPAKEISSGSLQNPSDPDAAYSGHKGQGFHVQVAETYSETDPNSDEVKLNLITYIKVEKANEHDSAALIPALDDLDKRNLKPQTMAADTSYGGDDNSEYAASKGVDLLAPVPGKGLNRLNEKRKVKLTLQEKKIDAAQTLSFASENAVCPENYQNDPDDIAPIAFRLADFQSNKQGQIVGCPMGQKAQTHRNHDNKGGRAYFDRDVCLRCSRCGLCPVLVSKTKAWLTYQDEQVRLDKRRAYEESDEFKKRYRMRSGIEATNSQLAKKGAKRLRIRGLKKSQYKMDFKALALNAIRVIAYLYKKSKKNIHN